ncbi:hypothetical protein PIB30_022274 [Stylosanthes scabra]|uniref:Uncharacterized protein n=1 Tax=Stylosanthes scabra TaxID=79078 RepID=A0ABU6S9A3_9FABA|nr:hypothetical protein [Stylosanthes scabra]
MARPHPLGGTAARPEIAKIHHHWSHRALARRPWRVRALHKCVAHSRPSLGARARPCVHTMTVARPRPCTWCSRTNYWKVNAPAPLPCRACAIASGIKNRIPSLFHSFSPQFLSSAPILSTPKLTHSHTTTPTLLLCAKLAYFTLPSRMDRKRKSEDEKRKGKLAMPPTRKSPCLAGLLSFAPPASPKSVLRSNKLLVLAIAAARGEPNPKAQASAQATVEKPSVDIKGKKFARISVKPLRKRFSQRIIARGGPFRPKPKKAVVIDLVSDEEEEAQGKETAAEEPPLVATQAEEEEEEDPKEYTPPCLLFHHSLIFLS